MDDREIIRALPKAEQHIHIVGSTRPETLLWLADESGVEATYRTLQDVESFFQYTDFAHFISVYSAVNDLIREEEQFARLNAVESSFLPEERKKKRERFIDGYRRLLDQFESAQHN